MKKIFLTLIAIFLISSYSAGQVKVNFILQNPRIDNNGKFVIDLYAVVQESQTWNVGNTCIRINYWTTSPSNAMTLIPENPVDNSNLNISGNVNYENMSSTSILNDTAVSLNILLLQGKPAYQFIQGTQWLGSLKFNVSTLTACVNMAFTTNSAVFDNLTPLTYGTQWTKTDPPPCLISAVHNYSSEVPKNYSLYQNYPNPFNPVTMIRFALPNSGNVSLKVYDILGREVANLVSGFKRAGEYIVDFDASSLTSGVYFYRLESEGYVEVKRMVVLK